MKVCPRCSELFPDDAERCPRDGVELRAVLDPLIGRTVGGRYRLISRLGAGGMSAVYLARHTTIDRLMAIKTLRRDLALDPVQRDRFVREARAVNRINHENIVEITDFGESDDGMVYLVMEYVPGETLLTSMSAGPFSSARALDIAEQIAGALARAHQMGIVHRDLKPENILLLQKRGRADFVKLLDFGIAKIMDAPSLTGSQQIFGTPGYIAPEYIQSTHIDGRADLYSLGVILYEMVTGALPFDYEYPGDLLVKHVTEPPIPPRLRLESVDPVMEEFVLRCLRKSPQERFRDAFHFLAELAAVRGRLRDVGTSMTGERVGSADGLRAETAAEGIVVGAADIASDATLDMSMQGSGGSGPVTPPGAPRLTALDYNRHTIPVPPALDGLDTPIAAMRGAGWAGASPPEGIALSAGESRAPDGLFGVRRWRQRFDAIRTALDDVEAVQPAPPDVAQAMARAATSLETLEDGARLAEARQQDVEDLADRAREFRARRGAHIDEFGRRLSERRGELERLGARREALRGSLVAARDPAAGVTTGPGATDALLWEVAAVEEVLRAESARCDELERKLTQLRTELEQHDERVERELAAHVQTLDAEFARLEPLAAGLRAPLDRVEAFLAAHFAQAAARA
jgi:tRNA A-37 threonylcarbamoyl transferase component Bud32